MTITCEYCGREQPSEPARCIGCGAPLPVPQPVQTRVTYVDEPSRVAAPTISDEPLVNTDQLKEGLATAGAVVGSLGIGSIVLRLAAEALAISFSALIIGVNGGTYAVGLNSYAGILLASLAGGALVGVCVTLSRKRTVLTLLSAPAGALLGTVLIMLLPDPSSHFPLGMLAAAGGAVIFALLGRRVPSKLPLRCLTALHPVLGAISGLLFALLGFYIMYRIY